MNAEEREATLSRLRDFAKQHRDAEDLADQSSLDRAKDIVDLYEEKENGRRKWALEMEPPKTRRHMGRPVDPESFSRFTKWLAERVPLAGRTAYQLRDAHDIQATYLRTAQITPSGEFQLRPLKWLMKHEYGDRVPEVWAKAVELAGGEVPDNPTVRRALAAWKKEEGLGPAKSAGSKRATGPQALRLQLEQLAQELLEQDKAQFVLACDHIDAMLAKRFPNAEAAVA